MADAEKSVQSFINALHALEETRDGDSLVKLFSDDAAVGSIALKKPMEGVAGAIRFWTTYRDAFKTVRSSFNHQHVAGDFAVLEWTSEGVLPDGTAINYQGISVLEFSGEKISRFRTYYDSAAFLPEGAKLLGREVEV